MDTLTTYYCCYQTWCGVA